MRISLATIAVMALAALAPTRGDAKTAPVTFHVRSSYVFEHRDAREVDMSGRFCVQRVPACVAPAR